MNSAERARRWWRPRCAGCGHFLGHGDDAARNGRLTWCEPCAIELDFQRGDGKGQP